MSDLTCADCEYGHCNSKCNDCKYNCDKKVCIKNNKNQTMVSGKCFHTCDTKSFKCDKFKQTEY